MNDDGPIDMSKTEQNPPGRSLVISDVSKQYKPGKPVFSRITMTFNPGDAVIIAGPNGSGKTTFLRLLSVNAFPTEGQISYGEVNIHQHPYKYLKHVGLVHDEESLPLYLSGIEVLEWVLRARKKWDEMSVDRINELFDKLQLGVERSDQLGTYSTGMRKKVQIAAAVITGPSLLILDEPLRGLDQAARQQALELISGLTNQGAICLMASHTGADFRDRFDRVLEFPLKTAENG